MKLHKNKTLFEQAVRFTADTMKIPAVYIEKDYWVTYALSKIFSSEFGKDTVFKGGTALSKCFSLIERFSEDIDLIVIRRDNETDSQMKKKLKRISESIKEDLPEIEIDGVTRKRGMNRKTAHSYEKEFKGSYGQVRDVIILESSWLGYYEPFEEKNIVSLVGKMMLENNQKKLAEEYEMLPFKVCVLNPKRTLCEKIMSLVRFSYTENPIDDLKNKVRHLYDLNQLLKEPESNLFFESDDFERMLLQVGRDDIISYRSNHEWVKFPPKEALLFREPLETWQKLESTYRQDFVNLVYGRFPDSDEILETLEKISERLGDINWDL